MKEEEIMSNDFYIILALFIVATISALAVFIDIYKIAIAILLITNLAYLLASLSDMTKK